MTDEELKAIGWTFSPVGLVEYDDGAADYIHYAGKGPICKMKRPR